MSDQSPTQPYELADVVGSQAGLEPWREPVRGAHPPPERLAWPGIDQVRAILSGQTPAPPISRLTGLRLTACAPGTATFTLPLSPWLVGARGTVSLGVLTMPADGAMGCAIMTGLPAHTPITTTELSLRLLRPFGSGGTVHATGRVVDAAPPLVLAEVEVRDDRQTLLAHGSSLFMTLTGSTYRAPVQTPVPVSDGGGLDPWERALDADGAAPLERLTGLRAASVADGHAGFVLPASPWFCAPPPGRVQGGIVAMLAEAAMEGAAASRAATPTGYTPVDLKVNYLRPLASDGRQARAEAQVVHSGRRIAVTTAEVRDADGRPVAVATGSGVFAAAA